MKESKMEIKIPMFLLFMAVLFGAVLITSKCYKTGAYEGEKQHSMDEAEKHLHFWECRDAEKNEGKAEKI